MNNETLTSASGQTNFVDLTADIVAAYISNNSLPASELPAFLTAIHGAVAGLGNPIAPAQPKTERVTPGQIRKSITRDALISFEDGKPYKTLKRHLTKLGLSPTQYRDKWGLPRDYPLVASSYSETRSALAKSLGLGSARRNEAPEAAVGDETIAKPPKAGGRKKAAAPRPASAEKPVRTGKPKKGDATAE